MADPTESWLEALPPHLRPLLLRAAQGLAPNVALMQLLIECSSRREAEDALGLAITGLEKVGDKGRAQRLEAVRELASANPAAFGVVRAIIDGLDHADEPGPARLTYWADAFDRAARRDPNASVALYALGNPDLLRAATDEVVSVLGAWCLLSRDSVCLDIGCGIGRFELALAPRVHRIVGIDIAPRMVEQARRNCAALPNANFQLTTGQDLAGFADASFSLVLAVDSFPYLVQAGEGVTRTMMGESARVLRPGGHLAILNFSYRGDPGRDRSDLARLGAEFGLVVIRNGTADFQLWDGLSFVLQKP